MVLMNFWGNDWIGPFEPNNAMCSGRPKLQFLISAETETETSAETETETSVKTLAESET